MSGTVRNQMGVGTALTPRQSGAYIAEHSVDVKISETGCHNAAKKILSSLKQHGYSTANWREFALHPSPQDDNTPDHIFVIDLLNFSFWSESQDMVSKFQVKYKNEIYTGYWSLCAALTRALDEGIPITDPAYYCSVTLDKLKYVFRSESKVEIPLIQQRLDNLHEVGVVLNSEFGGTFKNVIRKSEKSAEKLIELVTSKFPCFNDVAMYKSTDVSFHKRAQILVADLWACYDGLGQGEFNVDVLTMFADYRVPQSLLYFGCLEYSSELMAVLNADTLLEVGGELECEIRGCSIHAVEILKDFLIKLNNADPSPVDTPINSVIVDFYLWDLAKSMRTEMAHLPFHKLRSKFY